MMKLGEIEYKPHCTAAGRGNFVAVFGDEMAAAPVAVPRAQCPEFQIAVISEGSSEKKKGPLAFFAASPHMMYGYTRNGLHES